MMEGYPFLTSLYIDIEYRLIENKNIVDKIKHSVFSHLGIGIPILHYYFFFSKYGLYATVKK